MANEIGRMSATELARAVTKKELSCQEVVQAHLERIATVNSKVNAITVLLADEALQAAKAADKRASRGEALGPLCGVPITVKENIDLAGSATTHGVPALKDAQPLLDGPQVLQLKRAGAIPIGRTNMPDLGLRWHTASSLRGETLNPWDPSRTPGGSSGGDAVAIATGMTPLGLGNDYGGSLRFPAQCCGIAAIRPTLGRVPSVFGFGPAEPPFTFQLFMTQGVMGRHVRDLKLALAAMSGSDSRDPWWVPAGSQVDQPPSPVKVAVTTDPAGAGVDPSVAAAVRQAARALADAGYAVEEKDPPLVGEAARLWAEIISSELRELTLPFLEGVVSADALAFVNSFLSSVPNQGATTYMRGLAERNRLARQWASFQADYPLVLGPVSTAPPFKVGQDVAGVEAIAQLYVSMQFVTPVNLLGLPATVVPVATSGGLPQVAQIIAPRFREDLCLNAAEAVERTVGLLTPIDPRE